MDLLGSGIASTRTQLSFFALNAQTPTFFRICGGHSRSIFERSNETKYVKRLRDRVWIVGLPDLEDSLFIVH
ncbi:10602_t:CDS:2 [Acaulospora morrowiae]|uniref:10602_t:CDS:1 n=1 Tax=Acaulospora morrowiae TaxID=94023 RepID=A0A9N8Z8J8_9GLOM|nr:10602_t:CDS:2 [Acaulospora morrowiae]